MCPERGNSWPTAANWGSESSTSRIETKARNLRPRFTTTSVFGLPYADREHLTVFKNSSDKTPARERVKKSHELVLLLGDNLNDFKRDYYVTNIEQRFALMERDKQEFGDRFIVLPNPTDGHWVRAIFGESEPAPTERLDQPFLQLRQRAWDDN